MSDCCLTPVLHRKCDVTGFSASSSSSSPPASSSTSSFSSCSLRGSLNRPKAIGLQRFRFSLTQDEFSDCPTTDKQQQQQQQQHQWGCSQSSTSDKTFDRSSSASWRQSMMWSSASLPCLPASSTSGHMTNILPFLFLGSQHDALSEDVIKDNGITHILNVSLTSPRCPFVQEANFLRIPVNDSYTDRILPHFQRAFQFLDGVRMSNGCALVHCLAGISRSPTLVIAYVMRSMEMTSEEAYSFVKGKRSSISPNFNFLGQLLEYESLSQQNPRGKPAGKKPLHDDAAKDSVGSGSDQQGTKTTPDRRTSANVGSGLDFSSGNAAALNGPHSSCSTSRSAFDDEDHQRLNFPLNWDSCFAQVPTESLDLLPFTPCFALLPGDEDRGGQGRGAAVGPLCPGPQPSESHEAKAKPGRLRRHPLGPRGAAGPRPTSSTISAVQFGLSSIKSSIKSSIFKRTDHHNKPVLLMD